MPLYGGISMGKEPIWILLSLFCSSTNTNPTSRNRFYTKVLKVPISLFLRLNIRILIYMDDMLIMTFFFNIWKFWFELLILKQKGNWKECYKKFKQYLQWQKLIQESFAITTISRSSTIHYASSSSSSDSKFKNTMSSKENIVLNNQTMEELLWWIKSLRYFDGEYKQIIHCFRCFTDIWGRGNCVYTESGGRQWKKKTSNTYP